uniref:Uncharacterized protein LOC108041326 n=1 Tax=Drosophila rhopaloa TaxID=1041015 RepID=A0A6P4EI95_DRORH
MENSELTVPSEDSHWSLRFVDIWKPFPQQIVANATYKVIRFFYPPFALEAVDVTHVVSDPELNGFNVGLFLGCPLMLGCIAYAVYKYLLKVERKVRKPPARLNELEETMTAKYGPEYKQGIWERKDIPDPLLERHTPTEPSAQCNLEAHWLPESIDNFINVDTSKKSSKTNVTFNEEVNCRLFDGSTQMDLGADKQTDLVEQIKNTIRERSGSKTKTEKSAHRT